MSSLARLIETTLAIEEVAPSGSGNSSTIDLNWADKFSVQVVATVGDSIAQLKGSNDGVTWRQIGSDAPIAEGESCMFEQPNVAYRYAHITLVNDDAVDVSADCLVLVIGDSI